MKRWYRFLAIILIFFNLVASQPLVFISYAQDATPAPSTETQATPAPSTQASSNPEATPQPSTEATPQPSSSSTPQPTASTQAQPTQAPRPTPRPRPTGTIGSGSSGTTTGDSSSTSDSTTTTNTTSVDTSTPASSPAPGHREQRTSTSNTSVDVNNTANVGNTSTGNSNTGTNLIDTNGDGVIDSGEASSVSSANAQTNTNSVSLEAARQHGVSEDRIISNLQYTGRHTNDATVQNNSVAGSNTGANSIFSSGDGLINTGDAYSFANSNSVTNTNLINSGLEFLVYNVTSQTTGDLNLLDLWTQMGLVNPGRHSGMSNPYFKNKSKFSQTIQNLAAVNNQAIANADTGNNLIVGADGTITTGDAYAAANAVSLTNTNLINSDALFAVINILDDFNGNIIVPAADGFWGTTGYQPNFYFSRPGHRASRVDLSGPANVDVVFQNDASVTNTSLANANTGGNDIFGGGDQDITTGNSTAYSNTQALVNENLVGVGQLDLYVNNFSGDWNGGVQNWGGQNLTLGQGSNHFGYSVSDPYAQNNVNGSKVLAKHAAQRSKTDIEIGNEADVNNLAQANANTGDNTIKTSLDPETGEPLFGGSGRIETGNATAVSNAVAIANTNAVNSNLFWGALNIFGSWTGNLIFKKPDVSVGISDGQDVLPQSSSEDGVVQYAVAVRNNGEAPAQDVVATTVLPDDLEYMGSSAPVTQQGNTLAWHTENLAPGEQQLYTVTARLKDRTKRRKLFAGRNSSYQARTTVSAPNDPNEDNNSSTDETEVPETPTVPTFPDDLTATESAQLATPSAVMAQKSIQKPFLSVSGSAQIGEAILAGETVPYQIVVENDGKGKAENALVYISVVGRKGTSKTMRVPLGRIDPNEEVTLEMGIQTQKNFIAGRYEILAKVVAKDEIGGSVNSNIAQSPFFVRLMKTLAQNLVKPALAGEDGGNTPATPTTSPEPEVLGITTFKYIRKQDIYPYILAALTTILWLVERERRTRSLSQLSQKLFTLARKKSLKYET